MSTEYARRATVYLGFELHQALRLKAAETGCSLSGFADEAIRQSLSEDLAACGERASEPHLPF